VQATGPPRNDEEALLARRIRVLIIDDRMPGMSGRELVPIVARVCPSATTLLGPGRRIARPRRTGAQ
jgi:hypothetical protein